MVSEVLDSLLAQARRHDRNRLNAQGLIAGLVIGWVSIKG